MRGYMLPLRLFLLWILLLSKAAAVDWWPDRVSRELSYNESRRAYELFSIVLAGSDGEMDLASGIKSHTVFAKGGVMGAWLPPKENIPTAQEKARLFHHDAYADRISFEMFYGNSDAYEYSMPEVSSTDNRISEPKVIEYRNDVDEKSSGFSILYDCKSNPSSPKLRDVVISVVVPVVSGLSVLFSLSKTCGGGVHPYVEFGHYRDGIEASLGATRLQFGAGSFVAGPHVMSTRIYLHLHRPARSQEFFHPTINTSSNVLSLSTRGPKFGGILRAGESTILHVLYECLGKGKAVITAYVRISPFLPLKARWTKDCGGGNPVHLSIGSSSFDGADVVQTGTVSKAWSIDVDQSARANSLGKSDLQVINASVGFKDFYFTNSGHPLQIGRPAFSVDRPTTLSLYAPKPPFHYSHLFLSGTGDVIDNHTWRRLRIIFICKKAGTANVLLTLPIKSFSKVEFGFQKICKAPRKLTQTGFLRTANSFMNLALVLLIAAMMCWCCNQMQTDARKTAHREPRQPLRPNNFSTGREI